MKNNFFRFIILIFAFVAVIGFLLGVSKATAGGGGGSESNNKDDSMTVAPENTDPPESEVVEPEETEEGHIHEWGEFEIETAATCGSTGIKKAYCNGCNGYKTEIIPKLTNHLFNTVGVCESCGTKCTHEWLDFELDTTDKAQHVRKCNICRVRDRANHTFVNSACSVCNFVCDHDYEQIKYVVLRFDPNGHIYNAEYKCRICKDAFSSGDSDPHNLENGRCTVCDYSETINCSHGNSGWEVGNYSPYKPLSNGSHQTTYEYVCYDCGVLLDTEERIEACNVPGTSGSCYLCGYYYDSDDNDSGSDPDCSHSNTSYDAEGCWTFDYCQDCGATLNRQHTGYEDNGIDGRCVHCGEY